MTEDDSVSIAADVFAVAMEVALTEGAELCVRLQVIVSLPPVALGTLAPLLRHPRA